MEQTIEEGTVASIIVNVIDDTGAHASTSTIDTTTTRLSTHAGAVPTATEVATGVWHIKWTGLTPALSISDNDNKVYVKINGTMDSVAWSEYGMPVKIVKPAFVAASDDVSVGSILGTALTETTGGRIAGNFDTFFENADAATTKTVDDVGSGGGGGGGDATAANQTTILGHLTDIKGTGWVAADNLAEIAEDVAGLNGDAMRGTDGANTTAPDNASITAILADTNELQTNQGDWVTADVSALATQTSVNTIDTVVDAIKVVTDQFNFTVAGQVDANALTGGGGDDAATIYAHFTSGSNEDAFKADVSALATQASVDTVDTVVDAIKVKTDQLTFTVANQVDSNALTGGGGDDAATIYAHFTSGSNEDAFKADVSALLTDANYTASLPARFADLIIGSGADLGKVTTSNPAAGSGSSHTAQDVANLILGGTQDPIVTNASGEIVASNMRGTDNASTFDHTTDAVTTDAASRTASQADVSGLATQASVTTVDAVVDAIKVVTDQFSFTVAGQVDANALTGGGDDASTIYSFFTSGTNEDAFKADVSSLATSASITALNDVSAAEVADAVLDESLAAHNVAGSVGRALRQVKEGLVTVEASINDASPSASSFVTTLTETDNDFHADKVIVFINGSLAGQSRIVSAYNGSTKAITVDEPLTSTPSNGDEFIVLSMHVHPVSQIATEVRTELDSNSTQLAAIVEDTGTTLPAQITSDTAASPGLSPGTAYRFTNNGGGSGFDIVTITEN